MKYWLYNCPAGYHIVLEADGKESFHMKITEEEAELIEEKLNIDIQVIPF